MNKFIATLITIIVVAIALALIGVEIYVWVTYGKSPAGEVPAWALWFLFGGGRK